MERKLSKIDIPGVDLNRPIIIGGPCSAESREQVVSTAKELSSAGIKIFRAGLWKPRTRPGGFDGVGKMGLAWLKEVKEQTGMMVMTEVATPAHLEEAVNGCIDLLWIGARTTTNPFAMQELADAMQGVRLPILIKNPVNPDLELWCGAIERLLNAGVTNIGVIHRGFSSYERNIYRNTPIWHIPIELKRRYPQLTIFCDPSHIGGRRELIAPLCQQALDLNFDGLFIEVHNHPDTALSDALQQITPSALISILKNLIVRENNQATKDIILLREKIDEIDNSLLHLLSNRMSISREIGQYKKEHKISILQSNRYNELIKQRSEIGSEMKLDPQFVTEIMKAIHEESIKIQMEVMSISN